MSSTEKMNLDSDANEHVEIALEDLFVDDDDWEGVPLTLAETIIIEEFDDDEPEPSTKREGNRILSKVMKSTTPISVVGLIAAGTLLGAVAWLLVHAASAPRSLFRPKSGFRSMKKAFSKHLHMPRFARFGFAS